MNGREADSHGRERAFLCVRKSGANHDGYAEVYFVCEDNGIGMSKKFQKSMFEPFSQENSVGISRFDGVGLELFTLCRS